MRPRASALIASAALAGALVLALDVARTTTAPASRATCVAAAAATGALALALIGAVEACALALARYFTRKRPDVGELVGRRARAAVARATSAEGHALALAAVLGLAVVGAGLAALQGALRTVQDAALLQRLVVVGTLGLVALAGAAAAAVFVGLRGPLTRLAEGGRLPWPRSGALQATLWVALPVALATLALLDVLSAALGPVVAPLWLVIGLAAQVPVYAALRRAPAHVTLALALALPVTGATVAEGLLDRDRAVAAALDRTGASAFALRLLRRAVDVDHDGAASLLGGRDCAALDASRNPAATDLPNDGVDQDCSGGDATLSSEPPPTRFHDATRGIAGRMNVVWVIVDAVRADHVGFLGYARGTTPRLDELAAESLVFTRAQSQSSATMLSIPSMLVGKTPARMRWAQGKGKLQPGADEPLLAERLAAAGYQTGLVTSEYFRRNLPGLARGYEFVRYFGSDQRRSSPDGAAFAATFLDGAFEQLAARPFFLTLYLPAPHAPYVRQTPGYPDFEPGPVGDYDSEIAAADRYVGFVLDVIRARPSVWNRTLVVFVADHGEELGEHGGSEHARTCFVESVRVPLLLRVPGLAPERVERDVALVDVVPAIVDTLGLERPAEGSLDGVSLLLTALSPERLPEARPITCAVVSQKASQGHFFRRSLRVGGFTATEERTGATAFDLFDTRTDPGELAPLPPSAQPELRATLATALERELTGNLPDVQLTEE